MDAYRKYQHPLLRWQSLNVRADFVRNDVAFNLRDAVTSQSNARVECWTSHNVEAIGGGGLGTLLLLQRGAQNHDIRFRLFNPSDPVLDKLKQVGLRSPHLPPMSFLRWFDNQAAIKGIQSGVRRSH